MYTIFLAGFHSAFNWTCSRVAPLCTVMPAACPGLVDSSLQVSRHTTTGCTPAWGCSLLFSRCWCKGSSSTGPGGEITRGCGTNHNPAGWLPCSTTPWELQNKALNTSPCTGTFKTGICIWVANMVFWYPQHTRAPRLRNFSLAWIPVCQDIQNSVCSSSMQHQYEIFWHTSIQGSEY